jgi:basic membrane protein A and related proteins
MMLKWSALAGLAVLSLSQAGCGGGTGQASEELSVALVFDIGGRGDKGFNDGAAAGADRAKRELGVSISYIEPNSDEERTNGLRRAAQQGAHLVIGVGFLASGELTRLAKEFPNTHFAGVDFALQQDSLGRAELPPGNLTGIRFREEEGSFVVGAIAGARSQTRKVGFVGGMRVPQIGKFEAGYTAGVHAACPQCEVLVDYAGNTPTAFADPPAGHRLASAQYDAGADIIFHASGGTGQGVLRAAVEKGRLAIGVDRDQWDDAPGHVLTSMTKGIDVAVYRTIMRRQQGTLQGGLVSLGLEEGGVGYIYDARNQQLIPGPVRAQAETLRNAVIAGLVRVPKRP